MTAGLGTGHSNITTNAVFIPDLWAKEVQVATESKLVFGNRCLRLDGEVQYGDSLRIPNFSNPAPTSKSADTAVTFAQAAVGTEGSTTINITTHYECSYLLEDIVVKHAKYDIKSLCKEKAAYALSKQFDTDLATLVASFSQSVGTFASGEVTDDMILKATQYLDDADAPTEDRSMIIKPAFRAAMFKLDKFTSNDYRGDQPAVKGTIGDVYGTPVFVSTNVYASSSNISNCMMHKEAIIGAIQSKMSVETGRVIEYIADAIVGQIIYGVGEYRDVFGVEMKS